MRHAFAGWIPVRWCAETRELVWLPTGDLAFRDPFFTDTIATAVRKPYPAVMRRRTSADETRRVCDAGESLPVAGLILHMSRCGSTLVAQTLAANDRLLVLSEPPAFDHALRGGATDAELRDVVRALTIRRSPDQTHAILKLDCWHAMAVSRILRVLPEIPMIFVHRDPVEVLVSQQLRPSAWTIPGALAPEWFGWPELPTACDREEYCASMIGAMCSAMIDPVRRANVTAVSYRQLPEAIFSTVLSKFRITPEASDLAKMRAASTRDAKSRSVEFTADSDVKQRQATDATRLLARTYISRIYEQLD